MDENRIESLSLYIDDMLPHNEKLQLEKDISSSPELRHEYEALQAMVQSLKAIPQEEPPPNFRADMMAGVMKHRPRRSNMRRRVAGFGMAAAAVVALIFALNMDFARNRTDYDVIMPMAAYIPSGELPPLVSAPAPAAGDLGVTQFGGRGIMHGVPEAFFVMPDTGHNVAGDIWMVMDFSEATVFSIGADEVINNLGWMLEPRTIRALENLDRSVVDVTILSHYWAQAEEENDKEDEYEYNLNRIEIFITYPTRLMLGN